jgi:hypothetical protein
MAQELDDEQQPEEPISDVRQLLRHVPFLRRPVNLTELALSLATRPVVVVFTGGSCFLLSVLSVPSGTGVGYLLLVAIDVLIARFLMLLVWCLGLVFVAGFGFSFLVRSVCFQGHFPVPSPARPHSCFGRRPPAVWVHGSCLLGLPM